MNIKNTLQNIVKTAIVGANLVGVTYLSNLNGQEVKDNYNKNYSSDKKQEFTLKDYKKGYNEYNQKKYDSIVDKIRINSRDSLENTTKLNVVYAIPGIGSKKYLFEAMAKYVPLSKNNEPYYVVGLPTENFSIANKLCVIQREMLSEFLLKNEITKEEIYKADNGDRIITQNEIEKAYVNSNKKNE
jgi:hypothetical protein